MLALLADILFATATTAHAAGSVVINELMYHPASDIGEEEFLELYNPGDAPFDLSGMCFDGIDLCFAAGTSIAPGAYEVISPDAATTLAVYGVTTLATYSAALSNGGEEIALYESAALVNLVDRVEYDDSAPWPISPDGDGPSLELRDAAGDNDDPANWFASLPGEGPTPGAINSVTTGRAVINELMYNPASDIGEEEFLELHNPGALPLDLSDACFTSGIDVCFPAGTTLDAGAFEVISPDAATTLAVYGVTTLATYSGALSNGGETLTLTAGDTVTVLDEVSYDDEAGWDPIPDGGGPSLELKDPFADNNDPANWLASFAPELHTAGAANAAATQEPPTIEDITISPAAPTDADDVTVTALIPNGGTADLTYKVMFDADVVIPMLDDGASGDGAAGDGVYGATIPAQGAGELVRYRIDVADPNGIPLSAPPIGDGADYMGYTIADPSVSTNMPYLQWFMDPVVLDDLLTNHREDDIPFPAVLVYDGTVYDNIGIRVRGGSRTRQWEKPNWSVEFADGHDFTHPDLLTFPVDEFNLQSEYKDRTRGRAHLSWLAILESGLPSLQSVPVRLDLNGEFWGLYRINEEYDGDWRDRNGYSTGAMWKADGNAWGNPINGFDKKTREDEGNQEILDFRNVLDNAPSAAKTQFLWDNVDVPNLINYMAVTSLIRQFDQHGHNFYVYYDKELTGRWSMLAWDFDQTWQESSVRCGSEPMYDPECTENLFLQAMLEVPEFREMHYRRLRTMIDEMLTPTVYEDYYLALLAQFGTDAGLEEAMWGTTNFDTGNNLLDDDIAFRRGVLMDGVAAGIIPGPQSANPEIVINEIHYNPVDDGDEFIELYNPSPTEAVDLSGWTIDAADLTIPAGTVLLPHSYVVFVEDDAYFRNSHPSGGIFVGGEYGGGFSGGGELVELRDDHGTLVDVVDYDDEGDWPTTPDGLGPSLELIDPSLDNSLAASWAPSMQYNGTPGAVNDPDTDGGPPPPPPPEPIELMDFGSTWNYLDDGSNQGSAWRDPGFDDSSWASGPAELGYGDGDEATVVNSGPGGSHYITTYFRADLDIVDPSLIAQLTLELVRDDAAVVYVNGTEVVRSNLPAGTITYLTRSVDGVSGAAEGDIHPFPVDPALLVTGSNVIAVEIHQHGPGSSDISFDLRLAGLGDLAPPDTEPPTQPTNVTAVLGSGTDIEVSWDASTDDSGTVFYDVLRDGVVITTTGATDYTDTGVAEGTTVVYTVIASDASGNMSTESDPTPPVGPPNEPPTQPTNVTAVLGAGTDIEVSWTASTDNSGSVEYDVLRDGGVIATTAATNYTDTGLAEGDTAVYSVIAKDPSGNMSTESDPTPPVGPPNEPPTQPTGLTLDGASQAQVTFHWTASTDNSGSVVYDVYRDGGLIGTTTPASFTDGAVTGGATYDYTVVARDPSGNESAPSDPLGVTVPTGPTELIAFGADWSYMDDGSNQGSAWRGTGFDDSSWSSGPAELGYGDGDEATVIESGPNGSHYITSYFRHTIDLLDPAGLTAMTLELVRDDGAVVYINGVEVVRDNMPGSTITYLTRASSGVSGGAEDDVHTFALDPAVLQTGTNVIAVEVHQRGPGSSDVSFNLRLEVEGSFGPPDDEAPTTPTNVTAVLGAGTDIEVSWTASTDNSGSVEYDVLRDGGVIATTAATNYTDTGVAEGTTVVYTVIARDPSGNTSPASDPSAPVGPPSEPPTQPTGLQVDSASAGAVVLSWTGSTDNSGSVVYDVYRDGGLHDTTAATAYTDTAVTVGATYDYEVVARDPSGNESAPSNSVQATIPPPVGPVDFIVFGDDWRYLDDGSNQGSAWRESSFDDSAWAGGPSALGYGDPGIATVVDGGPSTDRYITTYFRAEFEVTGAGAFTSLDLDLVRDDGAVIYVNGVEVTRDNMPGGTITYLTRASGGVAGSAETAVHTFAIDPAVLVDGTNVIAVEIHQRGPRSSDLRFNLGLTGIS